MAVVQISKIQVRRGQKNSNSGIPQLSSAEFAWAVDTQELFIGNGSVAEGAPYVGNTKVLTEHDNILELASSYQFASDDISVTASIPRSLQSKLDEYVSVADFGAVGDGSTDCVAAFQSAFTQLFRNTNNNYKKVLLVPNGEYLFTSDLKIPSNVILRGETQHGAILNIGINNIVLITSDGSEFASFSSTNRPENIQISNLTIQRSSGQTVLSGLKNGVFENVKFLGEYILGNSVSSITTEPAAVFWLNDRDGYKVTDVTFNKCIFESNSISVKCNQTDLFDTNIKFDDCKFFINHLSIYIIGTVPDLVRNRYQHNQWIINDSKFEEIAYQAFRSTEGRDTRIQRCIFKNCGNVNSNPSAPVSPIIYFGDKVNNIVIDCSIDRQQALTDIKSETTYAVSEVENGDKTILIDRIRAPLDVTDNFRPLANFSSLNKYIFINYHLTLDGYSRIGQLTMSIGDVLDNVGEVDDAGFYDISITDSYQYSSRYVLSPGGALMTNFEFKAELRSNEAGDSSFDTVVLFYKNPIGSGRPGSISFDISYGV